MNFKLYSLKSSIIVGILLALSFFYRTPDLAGAREEGINKIEVFVSTYCYRISKSRGPEMLILKRAPTRQLYPNAWECGGGSVRENENFEDAARRQLMEEAGITASRWKVAQCFEVEVRQGTIVPGIAFTCKASSNAQVKFDPKEHVDFRWITLNELEEVTLINQQMRKTIIKLLLLQEKFY